MRAAPVFTTVALCLTVPLAASADDSRDEVNLLSWNEAATIVVVPPSESSSNQWSAEEILDEMPDTGWANPRGDVTPKVFVIEMQTRSRITSLLFDTAQAFSRDRCAKDVVVAISDRKDDGFVDITKATLAAATDNQRFVLPTPAVGRYVKLTVLNGYGSKEFMEIMNFKAYGRPLASVPTPDVSGTFDSTYGELHLLKKANTAQGCYQFGQGLIENGAFEGRVLRFTWSSGNPASRDTGPALVVFSEDGQSFVGHFWHGAVSSASVGWSGKRTGKEVGACPNWRPDGNPVEEQLKLEGRARLYGILFDTDSDHIKPESKPTLDALLATAQKHKDWSFAIEGYTDNVGAAPHNQELSEKRAAAVKAYLISAGVDAAPLVTQGFGATHPVASNDTSVGRAQNRRVEIVKK
jgi:outer membrane protein OmpA-like peptidoglycan-associated protein